MMKKFTSLLLVSVIVLSTFINASAATKPKITDMDEAIKAIEDTYLSQRDDGTFMIHDKAYTIIDNSIVNQLKETMELNNELIREGKITVYDNELKASPSYQKELSLLSRSISGGENKIVNRWYGVDLYVDAVYSNTLAAKFAAWAAIVGGGSVLLDKIPTVGLIFGLAGGVECALFGVISAKLWEGNSTNRGTIVRFGRITYQGIQYWHPIGASLQ